MAVERRGEEGCFFFLFPGAFVGEGGGEDVPGLGSGPGGRASGWWGVCGAAAGAGRGLRDGDADGGVVGEGGAAWAGH